MLGSFSRVRPAAIRRNVLDALRGALLSGRFEPDQEISDSVLAAEFQVSRGPVREALLILTEEGVLRHDHNRGFRIPRLTREDMRQIVKVREPLEIRALEDARLVVTTVDLARLTLKHRAIDEAYALGGASNCSCAELDFHQEIWDLSGNVWLAAALSRVCRPYFTYVSAFRLGHKGMTAELLHSHHERYLRYLAGDEVGTAAECVRSHLNFGE
ncbi:MAG TPA: GntR family transcriptional regulator [Bryobacteraceae bacterium]|nr:GntR family transcriptional regulator [Bryobacteraceae bacterium]